MNEKLTHLVEHLRAGLRGQDHVVQRVASLLRRGELGLRKPGRPKGSFLFLGPTGVGKTELTLRFTHHLFGEDGLFRFDMSEYQNQSSLALLLGANASECGSLGAVFDRANAGTLLFDEIEKAHPRILDIFLQILSAARVTLANGRTLDLSGFYIVLTSNVGPSNEKLRASTHTSWKSFMRLFANPSRIMASIFSAMTVSRGYALSFAAGRSAAASVAGNSTASTRGVIGSPKPMSICIGMRAVPRTAISVIRTPSYA